MVNLKTFNLTIILFLLLIISSCSIPKFGNSQQKIDNIDTSGKGLEFDLDLNDEWINNKLISYILDLENSGINQITLSEENIRLFTTENIRGEDVLLGFDSFNSNLFKNGELILFHDLKIDSIIDGNFEVKEEYFKDLTKDSFEINLEIQYDYTTEFANNIEIDMKEKKLSVQNAISQAAPVNIVNYKLFPTSQEKIYEIAFYLEDNGITSNIDSKTIKISEVNLKLGTHSLNSCSLWKEEGSDKIKISEEIDTDKMILNSKVKTLILVCEVDLSDFKDSEVRNTIISGEFSYNYKMLFKEKIDLPEKRTSANIDW